MNKQYYVYILASRKRGTLYVGMTGNLADRVSGHKQEVVSGFTREYHIHHLVYYEAYDDPESAIRREKNIKAWKRNWKIEIVEKSNASWKDLSDELLL